MTVLYISNGNIPSLWAHTFQTMKMAEAYAQRIRDFRFVVESDLLSRIRPRVDVRRWYGLHRSLRIVRLVHGFRRHTTFDSTSPSDRFLKAATRYANWRKPAVVLTRSYHVAEKCIEDGHHVLIEMHGGPDHPHMERVRRFAHKSNLVGVVTTLDYLKRGYIGHGVPEDKILVKPNGVDVHQYKALNLDRDTARETLRLPHDRPILIYVGHLYEEKGVGTVINAARLWPECLVLLVGGWDKDVERWRSTCSDLDNVLFTGFVENSVLPQYITAADMCVLPHRTSDKSAPETCPLKLLEYMAARRPTIVSDIPMTRAFIHDGRNALVVASDDAGALASAARRLASDPTLAHALADQAWLDVQPLSWDARAGDILDHFVPHVIDRGATG